MSKNANLRLFGDEEPGEDEKQSYAHLQIVCDAMKDVREEYIDYLERGSIPASHTAACRDSLPHQSEEHHRRYKVMTRVLEKKSWDDVTAEIVEREKGNALRLECESAAAEMRHDTTVVLVNGEVVREWEDVDKVSPRTRRSPVLSDLDDVPEEWIGAKKDNPGDHTRSRITELPSHHWTQQTEISNFIDK